MAIALGETPAFQPLSELLPVICVRPPVVGFSTKPRTVGGPTVVVVGSVPRVVEGTVVSASTTYTKDWEVPLLVVPLEPRITQLGEELVPTAGVAVQVGAEVAMATGAKPTLTLLGVPREPSELMGKIATPPGPEDTGENPD
jgi:hypothetical protein